MEFIRDSFKRKGQRILRSRCYIDGTERSLQVPVKKDEDEEELYLFLERRLYATTLPKGERLTFLTFGS